MIMHRELDRTFVNRIRNRHLSETEICYLCVLS